MVRQTLLMSSGFRDVWVWKATLKLTLKQREVLCYHSSWHLWISCIRRVSLTTGISATLMPESIGCSPAVSTSSSTGNEIGPGTSALRWPNYALVILRCWQGICIILDASDATCPHCNGADEIAEHLVLQCPAHDKARRDIWPGGKFNTDPQCLWDFLEWIEAVTHLPDWKWEREREREHSIPRFFCLEPPLQFNEKMILIMDSLKIAYRTDMHNQIVCSVYRNDPLVCLNYAVFLYNTGDKAAAACQFHNFDKRLAAVSGNDTDPEVTISLRFLWLFFLNL